MATSTNIAREWLIDELKADANLSQREMLKAAKSGDTLAYGENYYDLGLAMGQLLVLAPDFWDFKAALDTLAEEAGE